MLAVRGVRLPGTAHDTLVASYMVNPALRAQTLDDMAANRFGATLPPQPVSLETGAEEGPTARRAAAEALTALLAEPGLEQELAEAGLSALYTEVEMPLLPVLARMELAGVMIDRDALAAMSEEFGAQLAELEKRIFGLVGHEFNIGSPRAARDGALRRAGAAGHEADPHRAFDRRVGPRGAERRSTRSWP